MAPATLLNCWDRLTTRDKNVLLYALNRFNTVEDLHHGKLPFVEVEKAKSVCDTYLNYTTSDPMYKHIKAVSNKLVHLTDCATFRMVLNPKKVAKHFGSHPELGKPIKMWRPRRVTVGVKWSLPKRDHVPDDDVLVYPVVVVKPIERPYWNVSVHPDYKSQCEEWMFTHCT